MRLRGHVRRLLRARRQPDLEPSLRPVRRVFIDVRVPAVEQERAVSALAPLLGPGGPSIQRWPPASGPEIELSFPVFASSQEHALRVGRRWLERRGVSVLAVRQSPPAASSRSPGAAL
jgi:hypothetical protein